MSEKTRRLRAGAEAQALGGIAAISRATGISRATISGGAQELAQGGTRSASEVRVRRQGGGCKPVTEADPSVLTDLEQLVEPATRGDPQSAFQAEPDTNTYATGIQVTDEDLARVRIEKDTFHGDWNYRILPVTK